jgi:hypothetical protein
MLALVRIKSFRKLVKFVLYLWCVFCEGVRRSLLGICFFMNELAT